VSQAGRQVAVILRHPGVRGHVGEHGGPLGPVLAATNSRPAFEGEDDPQETMLEDGAFQRAVSDDGPKVTGVERLPSACTSRGRSALLSPWPCRRQKAELNAVTFRPSSETPA